MDRGSDGGIDLELLAQALAEVVPSFNALSQEHWNVAVAIARDYYRLLSADLQLRVKHRYVELLRSIYRDIEDPNG